MAVGTKSIYAPAEPSDGRRILDAGYRPRGVRRSAYDMRDGRPVPGAGLLKAYKNSGIGWTDFEGALLRELRDDPGCAGAIRELHEYARTHDIPRLCYEPDGSPCHRHLLKRLIGDPDLP